MCIRDRRNRAEFVDSREEARAFLARKWAKELDYRLIKELWAHDGNRIAVRYAYELSLIHISSSRTSAGLVRGGRGGLSSTRGTFMATIPASGKEAQFIGDPLSLPRELSLIHI